MDNSTILWIVIGVAVLLVIIAIIYAVTRHNDDETARRRPMQRRGSATRGIDEPDRTRPDGVRDTDRIRDGDQVRGVDPDRQRRGRRGGREPRA